MTGQPLDRHGRDEAEPTLEPEGERRRVLGRLVHRRRTRPGAMPGTLAPPPAPEGAEVGLQCWVYDAGRAEEQRIASVDELPRGEGSPGDDGGPGAGRTTWLNVDGIFDADVIRGAGEVFGWHPLVLEDIGTPGQRAKAEEYDGYIYAVLSMLRWDEDLDQVSSEQVSLVLGPDYVVTFQERPGDVFDPVRHRLRAEGSRLRTRGADYLAYALVDAVVDHYFHVLEALGDRTEQLEDEILEAPDAGSMERLHALRREVVLVRRSVWPVREMIGTLLRTDSPLVTEETRVYLRDVHDHAVRVLETVEALRDMVAGAAELYLSVLGQRTNDVMRVLTVMATIFIPLTFVAGVYGMNFEFMPELHRRWAYPAVLALMAAIAGAMLAYFRRKEWL